MNQQRLLPVLTLLFAMLFIQYGAAVHAAGHSFHEYEESCDIYIAAEKLADSAVSCSQPALPQRSKSLFLSVTLQHVCEQDKPLSQPRAPPFIFS